MWLTFRTQIFKTQLKMLILILKLKCFKKIVLSHWDAVHSTHFQCFGIIWKQKQKPNTNKLLVIHIEVGGKA